MTARALLVRGLLAGLVAGLATFFVAYSVGEPPLEEAIALEQPGAAAEPDAEAGHDHADEDEGGHTHSADDEAEVSRDTQRTWGLLTGSLAVAVALGGIVALVAAAAVGRIGRLTPAQSTALVALIGFMAFALVPFLKYPATPPAVGSSDTIGDRTALHFGFVLLSVVTATLAVHLALRVRERLGTYAGVLAGVGGYLVVVVVAALLLAPAEPVGDFPADTLWSFRVAALLTLTTLWGVLGVVLTGLVSRLHDQETAAARRRELALSL